MNQVVNRNAKIAGFVIVIAISALGYHWGIRSARIPPIGESFLIVGDSMAPTLSNGATCQVLPVRSPLRVGDVLAIRWGGRRHVKRLAAVGGDAVDLVDGRLIVNGRRLEDILADRTDDGFTDNDFIAPAIVHVSANQDHWSRSKTFDDWIVYTHHNPHQADQVTPVMDDYPINSTVRRVLNPVDRLVVKLHPADSKPMSETLSRFPAIVFDGAGFNHTVMRDGTARSRPAKQDVVGTFGKSWNLDDSREVSESLDAGHPIAIQIKPEVQGKYQFRVYREVEYRDDKPSGAVDYPLRLGDDEVFVVGDNVPVSVDSRQIGPLQRTSIIGRVVTPG